MRALMRDLTVWVGNKNYSSWSLRGWLAAKMCGEPFEEIVVPLDQPSTKMSILAFSPSGRVPAIRHKGLVIWDSLAIAEYLAETFPRAAMWPTEPRVRAIARAVTSEMHSGFSALRMNMPMNIRNRFPGRGRGEGVAEDIARVMEIWTTCRKEYGAGGDYLFGPFTIADAFYAPVVSRFVTYDVRPSAEAGKYLDAVLANAFVKEWIEAAKVEQWSLPKYDT
jgi:glutathione S-transferase